MAIKAKVFFSSRNGKMRMKTGRILQIKLYSRKNAYFPYLSHDKKNYEAKLPTLVYTLFSKCLSWFKVPLFIVKCVVMEVFRDRKLTYPNQDPGLHFANTELKC